MGFKLQVRDCDHQNFIRWHKKLGPAHKKAFEDFASTRDGKISKAENVVLKWLAEDQDEGGRRHLAIPSLLELWGDRHATCHQPQQIYKLLRQAQKKVASQEVIPRGKYHPDRFVSYRRGNYYEK